MRRLVVPFAMLLPLFAGARMARADAGSGADANAGESVIVILENANAKPREVETLDAIRAQVGDLPVRVVVERHAAFTDLRAQMDYATTLAATRHARGVFWVDTDAAGDALLFMLDPDGSRLLLRRIKRDGANSEAAVTEDVANVARAVVEALGEGRRIGMTAVAVEPPPGAQLHAHAHRMPRHLRPSAATSPARTRARDVSLATDVGWAGETWGARAPWINGTALGLTLTSLARLPGALLRVEYTLFLPATVSDAGTTVRLGRHPFDLAAGWEARVGSVTLGGELGLTLDAVTRETTSVAAGLTATPDSVGWTFALSPRARLGWHPLPWVGVFLRIGADVFLVQSSYAIGNTPLLSPDPVRLRVDTGLSFTVF